MTARLGFSVIAHIEPEILLIDEILAVGDAAFRSKCQHTMQKFTEKGTTLFLVSHDLQTVQEMCSRVIWIDDGRMRAIGDAEEVIELYRNPTADSAD
jgi:ABC-type polysaccharide/polyol phosphate transport system ATPase subunit